MARKKAPKSTSQMLREHAAKVRKDAEKPAPNEKPVDKPK